MPSVVQERMSKLMAEQKAEASLPTSRAVMDADEPEVETPETESQQSAEEMPLPESAPAEPPEVESEQSAEELPEQAQESEPEANDEPEEEQPPELPPLPETNDAPEPTQDAETETDDDTAEMPEPEAAEQQQPEDAEWDEPEMKFETPEIEEPPDDPYGRAMADTDWRMSLMSREQSLM